MPSMSNDYVRAIIRERVERKDQFVKAQEGNGWLVFLLYAWVHRLTMNYVLCCCSTTGMLFDKIADEINPLFPQKERRTGEQCLSKWNTVNGAMRVLSCLVWSGGLVFGSHLCLSCGVSQKYYIRCKYSGTGASKLPEYMKTPDMLEIERSFFRKAPNVTLEIDGSFELPPSSKAKGASINLLDSDADLEHSEAKAVPRSVRAAMEESPPKRNSKAAQLQRIADSMSGEVQVRMDPPPPNLDKIKRAVFEWTNSVSDDLKAVGDQASAMLANKQSRDIIIDLYGMSSSWTGEDFFHRLARQLKYVAK